MTGEEILALPMGKNDADAATIRDYLKSLLRNVWLENESFSGKRPFGNSDWGYELMKPLVEHGAVNGEIDEWGQLTIDDEAEAANFILDAIEAL